MFKKTMLAMGAACMMFVTVLAGTLVPGKTAEAAANIPGNVYRVYNALTGDHVLTASQAEYSALINKGLRGEGIIFYANGRGNDVYRLYNRSTGEHFYTANINEMNRCIILGWQYEGIIFTTSGYNDVYRLSNPKTGRHVFTSNIKERDYLWMAGWRYEGVAWKYSSASSNNNNNTNNNNTNNNNSNNNNNNNNNSNNNNSNNNNNSGGNTNLTNPVVQRASITEMNQVAGTNVVRPNIAGITNERFYTISATPYTVAQYNFTLNGYNYSLRASRNTSSDISGYYPANGGFITYSTAADGIQYYNDAYVKLARWVANNNQYLLYINDNGVMPQITFSTTAQSIKNGGGSPAYNYTNLQGVYRDGDAKLTAVVGSDGQSVDITVEWNVNNKETTWRMNGKYTSSNVISYTSCQKVEGGYVNGVWSYTNTSLGSGSFTVSTAGSSANTATFSWTGASEDYCRGLGFSKDIF